MGMTARRPAPPPMMNQTTDTGRMPLQSGAQMGMRQAPGAGKGLQPPPASMGRPMPMQPDQGFTGGNMLGSMGGVDRAQPMPLPMPGSTDTASGGPSLDYGGWGQKPPMAAQPMPADMGSIGGNMGRTDPRQMQVMLQMLMRGRGRGPQAGGSVGGGAPGGLWQRGGAMPDNMQDMAQTNRLF